MRTEWTVLKDDLQFAARPGCVGSYPDDEVVDDIMEVVRVKDEEVLEVTTFWDDVDETVVREVLLVDEAVVTFPSTQYDCPTMSAGQTTPGFRASNPASVRPQELATESQVSPLLATTL